MYIGLLTDERAGTNISYSYRKRGTDIPFLPVMIKEREDLGTYKQDGSLFLDHVGYGGYELLYGEVDIVISLGKRVFVDHIELSQKRSKTENISSEIGALTVLRKDHGKYIPIGKYNAETGKNVTDKTIRADVGVFTDNLVLRIKGECKEVVIGKLKIYGASDMEDAVYPLPESMVLGGGNLTKLTGVFAEGPDAEVAAANFCEKYSERFGKTLGRGDGNISFSLADIGEEEIRVTVTEKYAKVEGGSRRALLWGSEKLLQLVTDSGIKCARIKDKPFLGMRGVHLALPARDKIPFLKNIVKYVLMPMGYNQLILQLSGAMEYKRHPKINEAWLRMCSKYEKGEWPLPAHYNFIGHDVLTQDEVGELCDYIRSYGIDVVPEVQSFGHTQYITMAYPEMSEENTVNHEEFDLTNEDARPDNFYPHTMCPNHPDYYKVIFDIIDEAVEVTRPSKYVHIGHDEIYTIGACDRCKDIPVHEIYAKEVTKLHSHIKEHGFDTMMWSDMLHEKTYDATKAIDMIPKDILCLCFTWYFHVDEDNEKILYDHGYKVGFGNFYSSHFPRFNRRKLAKELIGAEVSTWVPCNELYYGYEGKFYDIIYSTGMFWNKNYNEHMRLTYTEMLKNVMNSIQKCVMSACLSDKAKDVEFKKSKGCVPYELTGAYASCAAIDSGEELCVDTCGYFEKLSFVQATDKADERVMWQPPKKLGEYEIEYTDGSSASENILYAANIAEYKRTYGKPLCPLKGVSPFRHEGYFAVGLTNPVCGKCADGSDFTLCEYVLVNPHPDKQVRGVKLRHLSDTDTRILIFGIKAE